MAASHAAGASALSHLECARCAARADAEVLQTVCSACGGPLVARYDLSRPDLRTLPEAFGSREATLWRFAELLPVRSPALRDGLGEGMTPLLATPRLGRELGIEQLWIKDEGRNPTGSFKARGMAVAVARAAELGARRVYAPSAGNAGLALAAYAARHGLEALIAFPTDIPPAFVEECQAYGAHVLVAGDTIREAGRALRDRVGAEAPWREALDLSTLREPYRLEGKKTMGFEIALDLGGAPDVVVYPTGGGTGLIGIWKAFAEMAALGWFDARAPRMFAVQMDSCAPIVEAFARGAETATPATSPATRCWGLRVPAPFADREILDVLRASGGGAVAVEEGDLEGAAALAAGIEGIDCAPEGAAALAALSVMENREMIGPGDRVVVLNTAAKGMYR